MRLVESLDNDDEGLDAPSAKGGVGQPIVDIETGNAAMFGKQGIHKDGHAITVDLDGAESVTSSIATDVAIDEFQGLRIKTPIYRTPVIEYLQRANFGSSRSKGGRFDIIKYRRWKATNGFA